MTINNYINVYYSCIKNLIENRTFCTGLGEQKSFSHDRGGQEFKKAYKESKVFIAVFLALWQDSEYVDYSGLWIKFT